MKENFIEYYPNGNKKHIICYYDNGCKYQESFYDNEGNVDEFQEWYLNGRLSRKAKYNSAAICFFQNSKIWWKYNKKENWPFYIKLSWMNKIKNI